VELKQTCCEAAASINVPSIGDFIAGIQKPSGEIPWSEGGRTDPWDHVESAMGLDTAGFHREADRAYGWLASQQLPDGSWYSATRDGVVEDATRDSNVASYVAVGLYHHFLITGDRDFLARHWAMLQAAINFAVSLQAATGEIHWAKNPAGVVDPMALLTGSSSVHMSLQCAARIARILGRPWQRWEAALGRLGEAICNRPNLFNMMKARFSMDWYYPILCGAVSGEQARQRVDRHWEKFVVPGWGVRCVSDQPWLTTAEGSELVMALAAIGENERAAIVLGWIADKKYGDGAYWMGVTFPDGVVWPDEKTSWTAAAILLAHDALYRITPAGRLFHHDFWEKAGNGAASGAPPERGRFADPGNRSSRLHRGGRDA
jgi:hypothetical protein